MAQGIAQQSLCALFISANRSAAPDAATLPATPPGIEICTLLPTLRPGESFMSCLFSGFCGPQRLFLDQDCGSLYGRFGTQTLSPQ